MEWYAIKVRIIFVKNIPTIRNTKLIIIYLISSILVILALVNLFEKHNTPSGTPAEKGADSGTSQSRKTSTAPSVADIAAAKDLGSVSTQPAPAGWMAYQSDMAGVALSAPPSVKVTPITLYDVKGSVESYGLTIGDRGDTANGSCGMGTSKVLMQSLIEEYEKTNSGDDGRIDQNINRSWINIYKKEKFTFNGDKVIKYGTTERNADSEKRVYETKYFVDSGDKRYVLTCTLMGNLDETTVDTMFKSASFN